VANPEFFELVYTSAYSAHPSSIDHAPIVTDRRTLNSELLSFSDSSLDRPFPFTAYAGDTVSVTVDDAQNLLPSDSNSASESIIATVHGISYNSPIDPAISATLAPFLKAADKCVRLMASDPFSSSVWVLVYRFWTTPEDSRSRLLLELRNFPTSPTFVQHGVFDVVLISSLPRVPTHRGVPIGNLPSGLRFVIYRFILFTDGFSVSRSNYRQAKAGGIYLLPMGLPSHYRRSPTFVHTVALSPPGVLATEVISHLTDKLVKGTVDGIDSYSPDGTPVRIFLDFLGFLTDFHESSDGVGTFQHNGVAGCNLCAFRRDQGTNPTASAYAFTTDWHSSNSSVQRTTTRQADLLRSNPSLDQLAHLGIHHYRTDEDSPYPLLNMELRLAAAFASTTRPFPPQHEYHFRAFQGSIVAPDHCIIGNIKNALTAAFVSLNSAPSQTFLNKLFREALFHNALPRQRQVFNVSKKVLHSTTFSSLFGIFLVSPAVLTIFSSLSGVELSSAAHASFDICCDLHSLVTDLYFWPDDLSDGAIAVDRVFGSGKRTYYEELQTSTRSYLQKVNDFYIAHPGLGGLLDVPNLHRLLELTIHTIPRYGHIRNVSDLTFEHKHQSLKRTYHRGGGNQENHNWAVESDITDEWKSSLVWAYATLRDNSISPYRRRIYTNFLISCFIGRSSITSVSLYSPSFQRDAVEVFRGLCIPSFVAELSFLSRVSKIRRPSPVLRWTWNRTDHNYTYLTSNRTDSERLQINTLINANFSSIVRPLLRVSFAVSAVQSFSNKLQEEQLYCYKNITGSGPSLAIYSFLLAVLVPDGSIYVLGKFCPCVEEDASVNSQAGILCRVPPLRGDGDIRMVLLSPAVRRVACYHSCTLACHPDENGFTAHSATLKSGGMFRVHTRSHGYPPRSG